MAGDPNTVLLIKGNGNFNDSSGEHNVTVVGDPTTTFSPSVDSNPGQDGFDESMYFDGDSDYLTIPYSDDWNFGNGDFTIDFWLKPIVNNRAHIIIFMDPTAGWLVQMYESEIRFYTPDGAPTFITEGSNIVDGDWHHLAVVRNGTNWMIFIDGVLNKSVTSTTGLSNYNGNLVIGSWQEMAPYTYNGNLDEIRISKGIARWTSDFQPPATPHDETPPAPPIANAGPDQNAIDNVTLDGSQSIDADGIIEFYHWALLHRNNSAYDREFNEISPFITDLEPGIYDVTLTVTDNDGLTDTDRMILEVIDQLADADSDGVIDQWDQCPDTVPNALVDSNGCEVACPCSEGPQGPQGEVGPQGPEGPQGEPGIGSISCDWSGWKEGGNTGCNGVSCDTSPGFRVYCDDGKVTQMEMKTYYTVEQF